MSMDYVRRTYGVPAKRGGRVRYMPWTRTQWLYATITGTHGGNLRIRYDGKGARSVIVHPRDEDLEYLITPDTGSAVEGER